MIALDVLCPTCGARAGERCVTQRFGRNGRTHSERVTAAVRTAAIRGETVELDERREARP